MSKDQVKKSMDRVVADFRSTLPSFNVGNITPGLIENNEVDLHGTMMPLKHISIMSSSGRRLLVQPFDMSLLKGVEKDLRTLHSLNTRLDGTQIIVDFPPVSDEYRASLVKRLKELTEDTKIKIRGIRKSAIDDFKKYPDATPQKTRGWQKTVQEFTDSAISEIESLSSIKARDIEL